jgi:sarcosine oxidase subunit gamma
MRPASGCVDERDASQAAPGVNGATAVALGEIPLTVAWNVRGDGAQPQFIEAVTRLLGVAPPGQPNTSARIDDAALLWMGPTSWMFVASADPTRPAFADIRRALNDVGGALFDVSSSYVAWRVAGPAAARVLNRGCPLDLHPDAFPVGHCAQSVLGHVTALFHRPDESSTFIVVVARSYARDAWELLRVAAMTEGDACNANEAPTRS